MNNRPWFTLTEEEFKEEREKYKDYFDNWNWEEWIKNTPPNNYGTRFSF